MPTTSCANKHLCTTDAVSLFMLTLIIDQVAPPSPTLREPLEGTLILQRMYSYIHVAPAQASYGRLRSPI